MKTNHAITGAMRLLAAALLLACASAQATQVVVPPGALVTIPAGTVSLGCGDLYVQGSLLAGASQFGGVRDVTIAATGVLDGGTGTLTLGGNWTNGGAFQAGTGTFDPLVSLQAIANKGRWGGWIALSGRLPVRLSTFPPVRMTSATRPQK